MPPAGRTDGMHILGRMRRTGRRGRGEAPSVSLAADSSLQEGACGVRGSLPEGAVERQRD